MDIGFTTIGDRKIALKFDSFPAELHDQLLAAIQRLTASLEAAVKAAAPYRTGALRNAITSVVFDNDGGNRIRGRVAVTAPSFAKAATLEYGTHRTIQVNLKDAGARAAQSRAKFSAALARPSLKADVFSRRLNIAAHMYLRGPLASMRSEVVAALTNVVANAVAKAA